MINTKDNIFLQEKALDFLIFIMEKLKKYTLSAIKISKSHPLFK
jgi:hypothetical protein